MSQIKITAGGHTVEVMQDDASATELLGVAMTAWLAVQPEPGQEMGFSGGQTGSIERAPVLSRWARLTRNPLHVSSQGGDPW